MTFLCDEPERLSCYDMGINWWSATPRIQTSHVFTSLLVYAFEICIKLFLCTLCLQGLLIHLFSAPSFFKMALSYHLVTPCACCLQKREGHPRAIVTAVRGRPPGLFCYDCTNETGKRPWSTNNSAA